jgi:serine/threonine protein kinase
MPDKGSKDAGDADKQIEALGWTVGKTLGQGAFGLVKLVTRPSDGVTAACKIMKKPTSGQSSGSNPSCAAVRRRVLRLCVRSGQGS